MFFTHLCHFRPIWLLDNYKIHFCFLIMIFFLKYIWGSLVEIRSRDVREDICYFMTIRESRQQKHPDKIRIMIHSNWTLIKTYFYTKSFPCSNFEKLCFSYTHTHRPPASCRANVWWWRYFNGQPHLLSWVTQPPATQLAVWWVKKCNCPQS